MLGAELKSCRTYKITKFLGQGASGHVYKAIDQETKVEYALKMISHKTAFEIEYDTLKKLSMTPTCSMYIVCLYDTFSFMDRIGVRFHVLVQDLMSGDLENMLKQEGKMSTKNIFKCVYDVLTGLSELHTKGYAHVDLKPENIFYKTKCRRKGKSERNCFYIGDVGLVCGDDETLIEPCWSGGTALYMSPELVKRYKKPNGTLNKHSVKFMQKSDVWSLGLIFYQIIMGINTYPFNPGKADYKLQENYYGFSKLLTLKQSELHKIDYKASGNYNGKILSQMINSMLSVDPNERKTIPEYLAIFTKHMFIQEKKPVVNDLVSFNNTTQVIKALSLIAEYPHLNDTLGRLAHDIIKEGRKQKNFDVNHLKRTLKSVNDKIKSAQPTTGIDKMEKFKSLLEIAINTK